jgi:hypothetical protein
VLVPLVPDPVLPVPPVPLEPVPEELVPPVAAPVPEELVPLEAAPVPLDADGVAVPADEVVDGLVVDEGVVLEEVVELALDEAVPSDAFCGASRSGVDLGTRSCVAEPPPQAVRPPVRTSAIATAVTRRRMARTVSPPRAWRSGPCAGRTWGSR